MPKYNVDNFQNLLMDGHIFFELNHNCHYYTNHDQDNIIIQFVQYQDFSIYHLQFHFAICSLVGEPPFHCLGFTFAILLGIQRASLTGFPYAICSCHFQLGCQRLIGLPLSHCFNGLFVVIDDCLFGFVGQSLAWFMATESMGNGSDWIGSGCG